MVIETLLFYNECATTWISCASAAIECIKCEGQWFAPSAFEDFGGKRSSKKWKQTIIYKDKPLQYWFKVRQRDEMFYIGCLCSRST